MSTRKKAPPPLIPPDSKRCQTEWQGGSFMTFGPRPMIRCDKTPVVIATEIKADEYGRHGSMSLCGEHMDVIQQKMPGVCTFKLIAQRKQRRSA